MGEDNLSMLDPISLGLLLSLVGVPVALLFGRLAGADALGVAMRSAFWAMALAVLEIAAASGDGWQTKMGLANPTSSTFLDALVATIAILAVWPLVQRAQRWLGGTLVEQTEQFGKIAKLSVAYRVFLVLTAGVVEEILYRGFAIGFGARVLGGVWTAFAASLGVFTLAHFRWGVSHLLSVFWAGGALSLLFVVSNDLYACIVTHVLVDAVGLLLAPIAMARRADAARR